MHTCACVCLCVSTCVCEREEAEGSAEPSEFCSVGDGAISQVQTLNLNHFLTLLLNLSIFLIRCFYGRESLPFPIKIDHWI